MDISFERENLLSVIENIDNRIEDFKVLIFRLVSYELDYSPQSIKYVELVGKTLIDKIKNNTEIQKDMALYLGETIQRNYNGIWDICESSNERINGQPYVKNISIGNKTFFPFLSLLSFIKTPKIGCFLREIEEIDYLNSTN